MRFFRRCAFAWIALLGIVFTQFAMAAYICPSPVAASGQVRAMDDASGMPCPEMGAQTLAELDPQQPGLCNLHCAQDGQSAETRFVSVPDSALVLAFVLPAPDRSTLSAVEHAQWPGLLRSTAPSPLWRSRRLRI